jgi:hypothetical protein
MTNDKSGLETGFCFFDLDCPLLTPQVLIRKESVADFVERLDWFLELAKFG